jgi:hypothetical protein
VLFNPLNGLGRSTYIPFSLVQSLSTWIVDLVLLLRVLVVFPVRTTRARIFLSIFAFPLAVKVTRLVLIVTFNTLWARSAKGIAVGTSAASEANLDILKSPAIKEEYVCNLADHM